MAKVAHKFSIPNALRVEVKGAAGGALAPVEAVYIAELTVIGEANAAERAKNSLLRLPAELAMGALVGADVGGSFRRLNEADGSAEQFLSEVGPRVRSLVVSAYSAVNNVEQDAAADFLASRSVVTLE